MPDRPSSESPTLTKFGDVVREVTEHDRTPIENGLERYVGLEHLDPHSLKIKRWGLLSEGTTFTKRFRAGQVLFGRRRAYQRKAAVPDFDGICSSDILIFEAKQEYLLPELLPFLVHTDAFFDYALGTSSGSLSPRTKWSHLAAFKFYLPPIDRQKELVELFQAIKDAIAATEESIAAAEQLKRSLMDELLTKGIEHTEFRSSEFGEIPISWRVKCIGELSYVTSGGTPSRSNSEYWNGDIFWVKTGEINYCVINDSEEKITEKGLLNSAAKILPKGTLLIAMYGQGVTRGKVALLGIDAAINQACLAIVERKELLNGFLYYYLASQYENLRNIGNETTQKNLNASLIKQLRLPVPSLVEQEKIATILRHCDQHIHRLNLHRSKTEGLKFQVINNFFLHRIDPRHVGFVRELAQI